MNRYFTIVTNESILFIQFELHRQMTDTCNTVESEEKFSNKNLYNIHVFYLIFTVITT